MVVRLKSTILLVKSMHFLYSVPIVGSDTVTSACHHELVGAMYPYLLVALFQPEKTGLAKKIYE